MPHSFLRKLLCALAVCLLTASAVSPLTPLVEAQSENGSANGATGLTREELERRIQERTMELEKVNQEISTTQENIKNTATERISIQQELKKINANINQLKLNIHADEIKIQKLSLEVQSLTLDVGDLEATMQDKGAAIRAAMRELQKEDDESFLIAFLRNVKLADSVLAAQALADLNAQLTLDINNLRDLRERLHTKLGEVENKKDETSTRRKNLVNRKLIIEDQEGEKKTLLTLTKNKESVFQKQLTELEKQQNAISDEISKIEDELRARFDVSILPTKRPGVLLWPVALAKDGGKGQITQHFGEKSTLYRGKPHNGLDIGVPLGTPVVAAEDGKVIAVDNNDRSRWNKYQYGKYVLIRHPNNFTTLYAHLSRQVVQSGQEMKRGDLVGYSGSTGYATGPHLHLGLYWAPTIVMKSIPPAAGLVPIGVAIAPEDYL